MLVEVETWNKDYQFGTEFYSVNCFNLSLLLILQFCSASVHILILHFIYSAHLREMLLLLELLCPISFSDWGQMTT